MKILLANIGNRNLLYDGHFISKDRAKQDNFFEEMRLIYDDFDQEKIKLKINILDVLIKEHTPDKIYLFVTHQDPAFHQDTYYEGLMIQKLLAEKNQNSEIVEFKQDPRNRDQAFMFFEEFFSSHKEFTSSDVIVSGSGGVPAMKEALNFYAVTTLKNPHIVDVDEHTHNPMQTNVAQLYLGKIQKSILTSFLDNHDYSGAYVFLKSQGCLLNLPEIEMMLLYLVNKYNFDIERANKYTTTKYQSFVPLPLVDLSLPIDELLKVKQENFILFIDNIEITYQKGEYTSLLGKIYALKETLARYLIEEKTQHKTENLTEQEADDFLKRYPIYVNQDKLKSRIQSDNRFFINLDYYQLKKDDLIFFDLFRKLEGLKRDRHSSIMAHGFGGASKQLIDQSGILDSLKKIKEEYFSVKNNSFVIAESIIKKIILE